MRFGDPPSRLEKLRVHSLPGARASFKTQVFARPQAFSSLLAYEGCSRLKISRFTTNANCRSNAFQKGEPLPMLVGCLVPWHNMLVVAASELVSQGEGDAGA